MKSVVVVQEKGTMDYFSALYVDGALILTNLTRGHMDILYALGVKICYEYVPLGYHGRFPSRLSDLKEINRLTKATLRIKI